MIGALVLAGGELERERFPDLGSEIRRKADIPIHGRPMVEWSLRALRACDRIGSIVVVGDPGIVTSAFREVGADLWPEGGDIAANLHGGLRALPGVDRVLLLSGDLPLVTPAGVCDLLEHAPEADLVFPYVERMDVLREFGEREWVFARTPEGRFTGCSAALIRPGALLSNWEWVERILAARRYSAFRLALLIRPGFALRYAAGTLRVRDVEKRVSALLHVTARGYQSRFPELAMDVDKQSDLPLVEEVLAARPQ